MGVLRQTLFGKIDLDTLMTMFVLGIDPARDVCQQIAGSASAVMLADKSVACLEVGGSGETDRNNFDHHLPEGSNLSACAQALRRMARLVEYIDALDRGERRAEDIEGGGFPSLAQLASGMLLVVKSPEQRLKCGLEILRAVVQSGIDPYGSMEEILDAIPHAHWWAKQKKAHEAGFETVCAEAEWLTTKQGRRLAVVETSWIGAPGALYGRGADLVIALNPVMEIAGGKTIRKLTVAGHGIPVTPVLDTLNELDASRGWGGPAHGTIIGSSQTTDSLIDLAKIVEVVIEML